MRLRRRIRWVTALFMSGLVASGLSAIAVGSGVDGLIRIVGAAPAEPTLAGWPLRTWLTQVQTALHTLDTRYPFVFYGTDWLAFGHFAIALAFVGAWRHPVRNRWLYDFGLTTCFLVIPYALVFGSVRGIPMSWRAVDCAFGVLGAIPLWVARRSVNIVMRLEVAE